VRQGYGGDNYPDRLRVCSAAKSGMFTNAIRREMRRRAAIEPVISHCRMRRNHLKGCHGDRINAVLAAADGRSSRESSAQHSNATDSSD
jgi:IS5 family transposase